MDQYYADVTRYTTSGFLRMKLGDALEKRGVAPHIYESAAEAEKSLQEIEGEIVSARVLQGLGYGLDEAAMSAAKRFRFKPATKSGRSVTAPFVIKMRFVLGQ